MVESLPCAICGYSVPLDEDHDYVTVEHKRMRDRDQQEEYILHTRCSRAVFEGYRTP